MDTRDYHYQFTVLASPEQVLEAITRIPDWWTINMEGQCRKPGDEFTVQFADVHRTTQRVTEFEPGKRMEWLVTESHLPWLKEVEEWKGTEIVFAVEKLHNGSRLLFTHKGLTPKVECYEQCEKGWAYFIGTSLYKLITEGVGEPDTSERTHMDTIGHVSPKNA